MSGIEIVAILGSSGGGKSTMAKYLSEYHGFERVRFAQPLKDMLMCMGLTPEQVDGPQAIREQPIDLLCGKSPRFAMQKLGTEWRDMIGKGLWAKITRSRISDAIKAGKTRFVIDDMRFPHEAEMFREIGCVIWAVRRPCVEPSRWSLIYSRLPLGRFLRSLFMVLFEWRTYHISETAWFKIERDAEIDNTGTLEDLYDNADRLVKGLEDG